MTHNEAVVRYHETLAPTYRKYWYGETSHSYGIHCGFWERGTKTLDGALLETNRCLATYAAIEAGDRVLDAGCGVGGSALWLADTLGVEAVGISICPGQVQEATALAERHHLSDRVAFHCEDYCHTTFADGSFDVVWAVESMCHTSAKAAFIREAYRLLAPGGRLIISDVFLTRTTRSKREWQLVNSFETGMAVPDVLSLDHFHDLLTAEGFEQVRLWDKSKAVMPSLRRMYWVSQLLYPLLRYPVRWFKELLGHDRKSAADLAVHDGHIQAGRVLYPLIRSDLGCHAIFCAVKGAV